MLESWLSSLPLISWLVSATSHNIVSDWYCQLSSRRGYLDVLFWWHRLSEALLYVGIARYGPGRAHDMGQARFGILDGIGIE